MAFAMMGGIVAGTILTLLFLPALYVAWFRLPEPDDRATAGNSDGENPPPGEAEAAHVGA
jgi:hypothetical protein